MGYYGSGRGVDTPTFQEIWYDVSVHHNLQCGWCYTAEKANKHDNRKYSSDK